MPSYTLKVAYFLGFSCCLQQLRVLNGVTWQPLLECKHAPTIDSITANVYREYEEPSGVLSPIQVPFRLLFDCLQWRLGVGGALDCLPSVA